MSTVNILFMYQKAYLWTLCRKGGRDKGDLEEAEILAFVTQGPSEDQPIHWSNRKV